MRYCSVVRLLDLLPDLCSSTICTHSLSNTSFLRLHLAYKNLLAKAESAAKDALVAKQAASAALKEVNVVKKGLASTKKTVANMEYDIGQLSEQFVELKNIVNKCSINGFGNDVRQLSKQVRELKTTVSGWDDENIESINGLEEDVTQVWKDLYKLKKTFNRCDIFLVMFISIN